MSKGILFAVTGPSGSGKTSIMRKLMGNEVVSYTTRGQREGEVDGVDYHFITKELYEEMDANGEFAETAEYNGNFYSATKEEVDSKLANGDAFFVCEFEGMKQIKELYEDCVTIFLYADKNDCEKNMLDRGDSPEKVEARLSLYESEMTNAIQYDYIIKNVRGERDTTEILVDYILNFESIVRGGAYNEPCPLV